ncbi:MAG: hypothetical protein MOIL_01788 [Candidatus Methanolliviera sp. GoM_oil]|nr:MAG: hypothetical protein MOIL_01788 [Candidatus Methanolliviera sp. GoM_oil]
MSGKSVIKIDEGFKKPVIQWQSWLQSRTGKYMPQGTAVGIACHYMYMLMDGLPQECSKRGQDDVPISILFEALLRSVTDLAESIAELTAKLFEAGELDEFDAKLFSESLNSEFEKNKQNLKSRETS